MKPKVLAKMQFRVGLSLLIRCTLGWMETTGLVTTLSISLDALCTGEVQKLSTGGLFFSRANVGIECASREGGEEVAASERRSEAE